MDTTAKISVYRKITDTEPRAQISISDFCWYQMADTSYLPEITAIRNEPDKAKRTRLKLGLPAGTISGLCEGGHKSENLVKHSGFIALDFDATDNPHVKDWPKLRTDLGKIKEVLFSCLSVSGKGCFCIIPISEPQNHKQHFRALQKDFEKLGLTIDKGCSDVSRLRYWSNDPGAIWNENARTYSKLFIEPVTKPRHNNPTAPELQKLVQWTDSKAGLFVKGNRNNWLTTFAGAANRFNIAQGEVENYCTALAETDFTQAEIKATIKAIYSNSAYSGKAV